MPGMTMIEIRHKDTGEVLRQVEAASLVGQYFEGAKLEGASFAGMDLTGVDFQRADLRDADFTNCKLDL